MANTRQATTIKSNRVSRSKTLRIRFNTQIQNKQNPHPHFLQTSVPCLKFKIFVQRREQGREGGRKEESDSVIIAGNGVRRQDDAEANRAGAARRVGGESRHGGVHDDTRPQDPIDGRRPDAGAGRRSPAPRADGGERVVGGLARVFLRIAVRTHPIYAPGDWTVIFPAQDYRSPRGMPRTRAGFRELPSGGTDAGHQGDPREIRSVLLPVSGRRIRRRRLRPRLQYVSGSSSS